MPIRFTKGHGTGNDFVLVADPDGELDLEPVEVARICDRRFGVGADGLMRAVRVGADGEARRLAPDSPESWFMDYRNGDGSLSEMCGNGVRVFVAFLRAEGLVELMDGESIDVVTRSGARRVRCTGDEYEVDLGVWREDASDAVVAVSALEVARPGFSLHVPNPHVVIAVADVAELEAADLGVAPVVSPAPAEGTNVELVHPADPLVVGGVGSIRMRVHERGSGETLSCGTGAAAAALATRHWAGAAAPDEWRVEVPGGVLGVRMTAGDGGERVSLRGPAVLVYSGVLEERVSAGAGRG